MILGAVNADARGRVRHVNDFKPAQADRFYCIYPSSAGVVRGWVGHRRDAKWFFVVRGAVKIGVVRPGDWQTPSPDLAVAVYTLTDEMSEVLAIPPGHFTACVTIAPDTIIMVFSTGRIEDASTDDYRLPADYWLLPVDASPASPLLGP